MKLVAVCIVAYNEEKNIGSLLKRVLIENLATKIFVYTDGSTDNTLKITRAIRDQNSDRVTLIEGKENKGQTYGLNALCPYLSLYGLIVFIDADVTFEAGCLEKLVNYLDNHKEKNAVSPLMVADTKDLGRLEKTLADIYTKTRRHACLYGRFRHLSGRMFVIRKEWLTLVPNTSLHADLFTHLRLPYSSIGQCAEAKVLSRRPVTLRDSMKYWARIGRAMASIKKNHPDLWMEQQRRMNFLDISLFEYTRFGFQRFFMGLTTHEKVIFLITRPLIFFSTLFGFYTYNGKVSWQRITSTKVKFS